MHIHSIWWLSNTLYMFDIDVDVSIDESRASNTAKHIVTYCPQEHPQLLVKLQKLGQWERWNNGKDTFIGTSTAYDGCQTPYICLTLKWMYKYMSLEPQTLQNMFWFVVQEHPAGFLVKLQMLSQWERWNHSDDASICTSTAYDGCQKPYICLTFNWVSV